MAVNPFRATPRTATPLAPREKPDTGHGKLYEGFAAKKMGARMQPASGAMVGAKGDLTVREYLIESKSTTNASLAIQLAWLVKITEESQAKGMTPALLMSFVLPTGRPKPNACSEWVAVPLPIWQELTEGK